MWREGVIGRNDDGGDPPQRIAAVG